MKKNNSIFLLVLTTFLFSNCTNRKSEVQSSAEQEKAVTEKTIESDSIDYKQRDNETMKSLFNK